MKSPGKAAVWASSAVCGMLAGWWLGGEAPTDHQVELSSNRRTTSERGKSLFSDKLEPRGFRNTLARLERSGGLPESAFGAMESADNHTLRNWMLSLAGEKIDARNFGANRRRYRMLAALSAELFRREGDESVRWAEGTGDELLMLCVLSEMARVDFPAAESWISGYLKKYQSPTNQIFDAALQGAASRSAIELLALEKAGYTDSRTLDYADDFDFHAYLANTTSHFDLVSAIRYWSAKDPDAVEKALLDGLRGRGDGEYTIFSEAYQGRAAMAGETEAARWIWPVLRKLTSAESAKVYPRMWSTDADRNLALWENASDDSERAALLSFSFHDFQNEAAVEWLNRLGSEQLRADTIARWIENQRVSHSSVQQENLEWIMGETGLSEPIKDRLRAELIEP